MVNSLNQDAKVTPDGEGGFIIDTEGINFNSLDDSDYEEEQNLRGEAEQMKKSWERSNLLKEVERDRPRYSREKTKDYADFYDGTKSFDELREGMISISDYVYYRVLDEDNSDGRKILPTDTILHDRVGFLEFNPIPFESTIHDGKPCITNLAEGPIIPGLLLALLELREGTSAEILIYPHMAYGVYGCPPIIPAQSRVFFTVNILKVWGECQLSAALDYEKAWHVQFPLDHKIKLAAEQKDAANQYLSDGELKQALIRYNAAIMWLNDTPEHEIQSNPTCKQLLNVLFQNKAITLNKLGAHKSASKAAREALSMDPRNIKAMYQLAKARIELGDHERALRIIDRARTIAPSNAAIRHLRSQIDLNLAPEKKKRDEIVKKMAKACIY